MAYGIKSRSGSIENKTTSLLFLPRNPKSKTMSRPIPAWDREFTMIHRFYSILKYLPRSSAETEQTFSSTFPGIECIPVKEKDQYFPKERAINRCIPWMLNPFPRYSIGHLPINILPDVPEAIARTFSVSVLQ